jgi:sodium transport system permease protein
MTPPWRQVLVVLRKELIDALRDRRTLLTVFISSVLLGPLVLVAISMLVASFESQAQARVVRVVGIERAASLKNYLERQTYTVLSAPADALTSQGLGDRSEPVVVVPADFEAALQRGDSPILELVFDSARPRAQAAASTLARLLSGFSRERATLNLVLRGVSLELLEPVRIEEHDVASTQTRATQITGMLPYFVMMAVLYGALNAALDTTAAERERGSLEPLLVNPVSRWVLVLGKWGAVACVSMLIAVFSSLSFLPGQWLLRSDTLSALFQYGPREAFLFLVLLLPFAAAVSALLMAIAIRCKSFKEAQASTTVVMLGASLLPMIHVFNLGAESSWHLWVPALAQNVLMARVLKGEPFTQIQVWIPLGVCAALTAACLGWVVHSLKSAGAR